MRCATTNSHSEETAPPVIASARSGEKRRIQCARRLVPGLLLLLGVASVRGVEGENSVAALRGFQQAQQRFQEHQTDKKAAWEFARACFDLADFATNNVEREGIAQQGIVACRQILNSDPDSPPAHYYLGLNLGQMARSRNLGALKLVNEMEREFRRASELQPGFDYGGADRSLGLLYRDAPVIVSIGNRTKARQHLQRAVELAPRYPDNHLSLLESDLKWNDRNGAYRELKAVDDLWPGAKSEFAGPEWKISWADWDARLKDARRKLETPARLEAPRH